MHDWKVRIISELEKAESARQEGNEGMARVCARRAAGLVLGEYFSRSGVNAPSSAYARLQYMLNRSENNSELHTILDHFLLRITKDHQLPVDADLIAEVRWLSEELLGEKV